MRSCGQKPSMSQPSTIAARLLAHARICREIADATLHAETANELERLARECVETARGATAEPPPKLFHCTAGGTRTAN
jgi:hypothetical protein